MAAIGLTLVSAERTGAGESASSGLSETVTGFRMIQKLDPRLGAF